MIAVLDHLDLNPVTFVRREVGEDDGLDLDPMPGEPPPLVTKARERLAAGKKEGTLGSDYLELLDKERYEKAEWVTQQALWAVNHIKLPLLPRLLGVAGSTYRMQFLLREACHTLLAGLTLARERHNPLAEANLLQRLAYVVADDGDHAQALRLAEESAWRFLRHGDRAGMGTALVDQGMWLYYLDRSAEAIEVQKMALEMLPKTMLRSRCTAFQGLALYYRRQGDLPQAMEYASRAGEMAQGLPRWLSSRLAWLQGEISEEMGDLGAAETVLSEVVEVFHELHLAEAAVATCDLARIQLLQGRPTAAYETTRSMLVLLEPLRHERIVSAAIAELIREGRQGLTLALVEQVKARIQALRKDPEAWAALKSSA